MANSLLTIDMITREALRLFVNSNAFLRNINRQYDSQFAKTGAKIGDTLRIRLPNDYTVRTGKTAVPQDTNEQSTSLTVATQKGVDLSFSSVDRALSLDDFSARILRPAVNNLAGSVAADVMGLAESVPNLVGNFDGDTLSKPVAETWLNAGAVLTNLSAPTNDRQVMLDPITQARTVAGLAGLFNPQRKVSEQYASGEMSQDTLGFDWSYDQTIIKHTNGTFDGTATVDGASQTGTSVTVSATVGTLVKGDVITFDGVYAVNRVTKQNTGVLAQFVVTANVAAGSTSIPIYPALIPAGAGNVPVQYQTVTASPANGAAITLVGGQGLSYRKNLAYYPDAFTLATADLDLPKGVHEAARESYSGISLRMITDYNVMSDDWITRLDILYGYVAPRPEWAVAVADIL